MSVLIGSARIDENGHITGGKAGDQTGKEVSTQSWYKHSKGWRVFRPKDPEKAKLIAKAMRAACYNPHIGYDQGQRNSLYNLVKPYGFDPAKAATNTETDCSALVRVCCAYAGITIPDCNTSTLPAALLKSGQFDELTDSKYTDKFDYLRAGDVLVTKTKGHTAVVLTDGPKAEKNANADENSTNANEKAENVSGKRVVATGNSVNVRSGPSTDWSILTSYDNGKELEYLATACISGWHAVIVHKGNTRFVGWISPKFSKVVE